MGGQTEAHTFGTFVVYDFRDNLGEEKKNNQDAELARWHSGTHTFYFVFRFQQASTDPLEGTIIVSPQASAPPGLILAHGPLCAILYCGTHSRGRQTS